MTTPPPDDLVPYVISVTGHRDVREQDVETLRTRVFEVLRLLKKRMPHTPIIMLNALAEGADQLCAQCAVEEKITLVGVLPMPLAVYREQLPQEARGAFETLLAACIVVHTLPSTGHTDASLRASENLLAEQYAQLGRYLVRNSQALLALWDGARTEKPGGTAQVVRLMREGLGPEEGLDEEPATGLVYHIVTARQASAEPPGDLHTLHVLDTVPAQTGSQEPGQALSTSVLLQLNLDSFNASALRLGGRSHISNLVADEVIFERPFLTRLHEVFRTADVLANRASRHRSALFYAIVIAASSGTLSFALYEHLFNEYLRLWLVFPALVGIAVGLYSFAKRSRVDEHYIDRRALAEALRVQFFWELSTIATSVADYYLPEKRTEMDWIRSALRNIWLLRPDTVEDTPPTSANFAVVQRAWIEHQMNWYGTRFASQRIAVNRREAISRYSLVVVMVWSTFVPLSLLWHHPQWSWLTKWQHIGGNPPWDGLLHLFLVFPPLFAGAYRFWVEQRGYVEQARLYQRMATIFTSKLRGFLAADTSDKQREALLGAGLAALDENSRWLLLHRERPLEIMSS